MRLKMEDGITGVMRRLSERLYLSSEAAQLVGMCLLYSVLVRRQ